MAGPLEGLRVIDFTRVLAGPHCTKALRDLGADVTKIEPPSGDLARISLPHVGDMGLYFVQQNAGKRNLSIDLNWAEAREIVTDMCKDADVIVENFRPGTLARFGLSYEDVKAFNPTVVYVSLSGYGQSTSWKNRPAFAPTVQAETGFTAMVGDHFGDALSEPRNDACSHADVYTGLQGVVAILAALHNRHVTGEGQHVDVSMAATMMSINERAGAMLSGIDTDGEPIALSANRVPHFRDVRWPSPDDRRQPDLFADLCALLRDDAAQRSEDRSPLCDGKSTPSKSSRSARRGKSLAIDIFQS